MRIFVDESGTHADSRWFVIGMLFVPDHGPLHSDLCAVKEQVGYLNGTARKARYKEIHLTDFKRTRDVEVGKAWIDLFLKHDCYFRSIVIDWSKWDGRHFGDAFDPDALKKRRAYKKWAEMVLRPEIGHFRDATLYLDRLRILYGYDILDHLKNCFAPPRAGIVPRIGRYLPSDSWTDAMQCLQLADLLTGSVGQRLTPAASEYKRAVTEYLYAQAKPYHTESVWGSYETNIQRGSRKFSEWFWKPEPTRKPSRKR